MTELETLLRDLKVGPKNQDRLMRVVEKMNTEAYNRGLDEGMKATDPEVLYGRMLAEEERNKVPAPIWG